MPRQPRLFLSQSYYHIMTRGNNRHQVFRSDDDYVYYLDLIKRYKSGYPFDLFHYCLMSNHVHLLIKTKKASEFSVFMKKLNLSYFHHYNKLYGWVGYFWQDRFKSQPVGKDEYFMQCGKYIELNPVRANLVKKPEEYSYSSYNYYTKGDRNELITEDMFYDSLGSDNNTRQKNYRDMVILELVGKSYTKPVWGSDQQRYQEIQKVVRHEKATR